jgi:glycosyltransferase involved in cell wall biosynthesis
MSEPLVSVVIPCYNAERWIEDCLTSVLEQTHAPIEILVVDDGSTDGSAAIAKRFQKDGVRLFQQTNRGAPLARNVGLAHARGAYIQYLDADDLLSADKIESQVRLLERYPEHVAVSATMYFRDRSNPADGRLEGGWPLIDTDDCVEWLIDLMDPSRAGMVQPGAWLVPRAISDRAGAWRGFRALDDDGEYFCRVLLASRGIRRSESGHNYYRQFPLGGSVSKSLSPEMQWGGFFMLKEKAAHLLERSDSERLRRFLAGRFIERAVAGYPSCRQLTRAALAQAEAFGGTDFFPSLGGWRIEAVRKIFGWRFARIVSALSLKARRVLVRRRIQ